MNKRDGGPAFPRIDGIEQGAYGRQDVFVTDGMSLRDWFAGQALITVLTHWPSAPASVNARRAYTIADAMLAEKEV